MHAVFSVPPCIARAVLIVKRGMMPTSTGEARGENAAASLSKMAAPPRFLAAGGTERAMRPDFS